MTKKTNVRHKRSTPMNPDGSLTIDLHIEAIPDRHLQKDHPRECQSKRNDL